MRSDPPVLVVKRKWRPRDVVVGDDGLLRPVWRALAFVTLVIPLAILLQTALRSAAPSLQTNARLLVGSSVLAALVLLVSWGFLALLDRRSFRALGLWFYSAWAREFVMGIGIGGALMAVVVGLQVVLGGIRYAGVGSTPQAALSEAGLLAVVFLVWAALEEILFRGYAFQRLMDAFGIVAAITIFSVPFALGHFGTPGATWLSTTNTVLQGMVFAVAYLKTRALWLPIGIHFAWNYMMMAVLSLHLGNIQIQFDQALFRVELLGPDWLSGGSYGPEGSVVLTVVAVGLLIWIVRTPVLTTSAAMDYIVERREAAQTS